jgi:hypothetical protein
VQEPADRCGTTLTFGGAQGTLSRELARHGGGFVASSQ